MLDSTIQKCDTIQFRFIFCDHFLGPDHLAVEGKDLIVLAVIHDAFYGLHDVRLLDLVPYIAFGLIGNWQ